MFFIVYRHICAGTRQIRTDGPPPQNIYIGYITSHKYISLLSLPTNSRAYIKQPFRHPRRRGNLRRIILRRRVPHRHLRPPSGLLPRRRQIPGIAAGLSARQSELMSPLIRSNHECQMFEPDVCALLLLLPGLCFLMLLLCEYGVCYYS